MVSDERARKNFPHVLKDYQDRAANIEDEYKRYKAELKEEVDRYNSLPFEQRNPATANALMGISFLAPYLVAKRGLKKMDAHKEKLNEKLLNARKNGTPDEEAIALAELSQNMSRDALNRGLLLAGAAAIPTELRLAGNVLDYKLMPQGSGAQTAASEILSWENLPQNIGSSLLTGIISAGAATLGEKPARQKSKALLKLYDRNNKVLADVLRRRKESTFADITDASLKDRKAKLSQTSASSQQKTPKQYQSNQTNGGKKPETTSSPTSSQQRENSAKPSAQQETRQPDSKKLNLRVKGGWTPTRVPRTNRPVNKEKVVRLNPLSASPGPGGARVPGIGRGGPSPQDFGKVLQGKIDAHGQKIDALKLNNNPASSANQQPGAPNPQPAGGFGQSSSAQGAKPSSKTSSLQLGRGVYVPRNRHRLFALGGLLPRFN